MRESGKGASVPLHSDWLWRRILKRALVEDAGYALSEVQSYCLDSALARGGLHAAKRMIADWRPGTPPARPGAYVSRWVPGTHYYALDHKFPTFEDAKAHLETHGYTCLGLKRVSMHDF